MALKPTTLKDLEKLGLKPPTPFAGGRMVTQVAAREKRGKTHYSLTADDPIIYIDNDIGSEGVVDKFLDTKDILAYRFRIDKDDGTQKEWKEQWEEQDKVIRAALGLKEQGTLIIDTWCEDYELVRLAEWGKLENIQREYGVIYSKLIELIRLMYESSMNTILIVKLKPVYNQPGRFEPAGWKDTPFRVQTYIELDREDLRGGDCSFSATIRDSRLAKSMIGSTFEDEACDFEIMKSAIFAARKKEMQAL